MPNQPLPPPEQQQHMAEPAVQEREEVAVSQQPNKSYVKMSLA